MEATFSAILEQSTNKLWGAHFRVPPDAVEAMLASGSNRVVCLLNGVEQFQCAILSGVKGAKVITVNKGLREKLRLNVGDEVQVQLQPDESEYGLPLTEELESVLAFDKEGNEYFHALTLGKQRTLLYIAAHVKNPEVRALRAVAIIEHLKVNKGNIDYRQLNAEIKTRSKLR